jgi:hypothetical protein
MLAQLALPDNNFAATNGKKARHEGCGSKAALLLVAARAYGFND